ncbi:hypothetical protein L598_005100000110 [Mesorhizobium sp. J18]|uniref:DUF7065 domain-containing protein n=1 Tax=Mesorhizobium sp. J18 TaxID=935263 RepID=UPI001199A2C0|nr:hypothetical protein [Mesorhizobium sp. J18]TWG92065.1 hypothetical protein L598_005100000110 [Mesorhizobium sp. J18]
MNVHESPQITPRDDSFHFNEMSDRWWITETAWFSFCKPEMNLGGWLYSMFRPNIGTVAGGAWVWDDSASVPWEVPYSANYTALRIPENADLNDIALPTGVSLKTLKPLTTYRLGFHDEDRLMMDLIFDATMPPRPMRKANSSFQKLSHFDQFGHVTGTITLHGRVIDIDCLAIRDRSWGPRPEHRPGRSAYVTGIASPGDAFLAVTKWNDPDYAIAYGFLMEDGIIGDIVSGRRMVERDPETGYVARITIEGRDEHGRELQAEGRRLSGIVLNRHSFIDSNSLIEWSINGKTGHGEDQDMWPVHSWSAMRRQMREGAAA